jgi:hypothetical protein
MTCIANTGQLGIGGVWQIMSQAGLAGVAVTPVLTRLVLQAHASAWSLS